MLAIIWYCTRRNVAIEAAFLKLTLGKQRPMFGHHGKCIHVLPQMADDTGTSRHRQVCKAMRDIAGNAAHIVSLTSS